MRLSMSGIGSQLGTTLRDKGGPFGIISGVGAFVSDVLEPIAPFCEYIFYVGGVGAVFLLLTFAIYHAVRGRLMPALTFLLIATGFAGMLFAMQGNDDDNNGFMADVIPGITRLQETLGIVQKDVAEIKKTTANIQQDTQAIRAAVVETNQQLSQLTAGIQGGLVVQPKTAQAFYHNARIHELDGNYAGARQAYAGYFRFDQPHVDPYFRYARMLRTLEGRAGAREELADLRGNSPAKQLAAATLYNQKIRLKRYAAISAAHAKFGPLYYQLAAEYSEAQLGEQTLSDKRQEKKALSQMMALEKDGHFSRWYVDKEAAQQAIDDAERRLKVLNSLALESPMTILPMRTNQGWMINVMIPDATELFYRVGSTGDFESTGNAGYTDPTTGKAMPNPIITLPNDSGPTQIYVKYSNKRGQMEGPYEYPFEPLQALVTEQRRNLKVLRHSLISFREYENQQIMYWTTLVSYRCALKGFSYGKDSAPDTRITLAPCDIRDPMRVVGDMHLVHSPRVKKFVSIILHYRDGTDSKAMNFNIDSHSI